MKELSIKAEHTAVGLLIQIGPEDKIMELVLHCNVVLPGSTIRRDIWLQNPSEEILKTAQDLVDKTIQTLLKEE